MIRILTAQRVAEIKGVLAETVTAARKRGELASVAVESADGKPGSHVYLAEEVERWTPRKQGRPKQRKETDHA